MIRAFSKLAMSRVPTIREVIPGAEVNIVLKADQRTGRTVSGAVQQVLTKGNHPRGIKVRLEDGRVGRVQTMVGGAGTSATTISRAAAASAPPTSGGANLPRAFPSHYVSPLVHSVTRPGPSQALQRPVDGRSDEPAPQFTLDAFIKPARQRNRGMVAARRSGSTAEVEGKSAAATSSSAPESQDTEPSSSATGQSPQDNTSVRCPVCLEFEGDAMAVSHHIGTHYDN
ncbi:hypothetical protein B0H63DRAFT_86548 [Podospora didyma]|uniref:Uncharacterized protein n=1 Tax=Podospora didyma TaxID=330526 RepID=A0AAE0K1C7_9PEZI|nr:hypothetical protein B0H63DRAFT_86548 [Podospora didyma]